MEEVDNVLRILRETQKLVRDDRPDELKGLSNQTIHTAAISQDPDNIVLAVLVYSLSKVFERGNYRGMEGWNKFYSSLIKNLEEAIKSLANNDVEKCRDFLGKIRDSINRIEGSLSIYIQDVFKKAQINKAFKLYEHGLSSEQTAKLLGVSLWDLASYIGQSTIHEANVTESMPIEKRIKIATEIFG